MRYTQPIAVFAAIVAVGLAPATTHAAASKEENIGVGTGAVVGALAGGPIGFVIGAGVGAKLGENMHRKSQRIDTLQESLADASDAVTRLEHDTVKLNAALDHAEKLAQPELLSLMQAGIEMDLLFRTDESALTDATTARLDALARTLASMPDVNVRLDGFADERGDAQYNQTLSERRVEFVRDLFVTAGVDPSRIDALAHGESVAADTSMDSLALERRVSLKLFVSDAPEAIAANPF